MKLSICIISWLITVIAASLNQTEEFIVEGLLAKLQVKLVTNDSAVLHWSPSENEKENLFVLFRDFYSQQVTPPEQVLFEANNRVIIKLTNLHAGRKYSSELCQHPGTVSTTNFQCLTGKSHFSTRPNPPANFTSISSTETEMIINWNPPAIPCSYSHYQAYIEPFEGRKTTTDIDEQAIFRNLIPGKLYQITVKTVSNYEVSDPIIHHHRTRPNLPSNIVVLINETPFKIFPLKVVVSWSDPQSYSEFDKFAVFLQQSPALYDALNIDSVSSFSVPRNKHSWTFENLVYCENYRVIIQTISANIYSVPAYYDFRVEKEPLLCLKKT